MAFDMMVAHLNIEESDGVEYLHLDINIGTQKVTREQG
jgi:hypothetical protein